MSVSVLECAGGLFTNETFDIKTLTYHDVGYHDVHTMKCPRIPDVIHWICINSGTICVE